MKKGLIASYFSGITDTAQGEKFSTILALFLPEFITSFVLFALPLWLDAHFISHLKSTPTYATLGVTNNLIHLLFKLAEAASIGVVVLVGHFNGLRDYAQAGKVLRDSFWTTVFLGTIISLSLYFGAYIIYGWLDVPSEIVAQGVPFLRLRSIGVFFMFVYLAFIGFLRGIKNTKTPMYIFVIGALVFVIFDYSLIFGAFGFPALGLTGSAWASVLQSGVMALASVYFVFGTNRYREYGLDLFTTFGSKQHIIEFLRVVWPVALDKASLAVAYIWLNKMVNPLGTCAVATFCVMKDMERFAFLPAIACAQVITILVSNDYGLHKWQAIKSNIKKMVFMASLLVFSLLLIFSVCSRWILYLFDKQGEFTEMAVRIFPLLSVLVFFDLLQLILSGALRGAGNVKVVMYVRLIVCFAYFFPVSYGLSILPLKDQGLKFFLIYGSFYVGNALMSIVYIKRFRGQRWKQEIL